MKSTTDGTGAFQFEWPAGSRATFMPLLIEGPNVVARSVMLGTSSSREFAIDAIPLGDWFDLTFYREFARSSKDNEPGVLNSLRRWTRAPMIYLKTIDEAGEPIDSATLETVTSAFADEAAAWTGGRFGIAGVERGTESREGVSGWITVKWPSPFDPQFCGRAQVALDGGWIELNYFDRSGCGCGGASRMGAGVVRHELAHAMGFYHTNERGGVLGVWGTTGSSNGWCHARPSAQERAHAALVYSRPIGNTDPDADPRSIVQSHPGSVPIVVD